MIDKLLLDKLNNKINKIQEEKEKLESIKMVIYILDENKLFFDGDDIKEHQTLLSFLVDNYEDYDEDDIFEYFKNEQENGDIEFGYMDEIDDSYTSIKWVLENLDEDFDISDKYYYSNEWDDGLIHSFNDLYDGLEEYSSKYNFIETLLVDRFSENILHLKLEEIAKVIEELEDLEFIFKEEDQ